MALDKNNYVEVLNWDLDYIREQLDNGKTILAAVEAGPIVQESLKNGYSNYIKAKIELKEMNENLKAVCACDNPANALIWLWRD
ncbi:hypothetical protein [Spiroplasma endosymbiont of Labia minor]|uniref:hypothetical protein n=1 Tax=Spiroplasma endosymbiont of Labia minor TaxID=3066305 RepID=UPI0030D3EAE6